MPHLDLPLRSLLGHAMARVGDFARDERGVTLIEFGILAVPFFTIIVAILQTAIMFLVAQVLDSSLEEASRRVRTGEASGYTLDTFRSYMCQSTYGLIDCSQIKLKSQVLDDFTKVTKSPPLDCTSKVTCVWTTSWETFDPGVGRSVMEVSAFYRYPLIIVLPYFNLKNQPDNYRLLSAIRVFRNEPFS